MAVKAFEKLRYAPVRQKGSHIRMKHLSDASKTPISIPNHKVLGKGLLRKLLRDTDITMEEFMKVI
ncbi:putative RNA binding protein YcfA, dsRBD-like fold, HicA-like mRNA interferase family [Candidatus Methanomarinus sp.]|nr:putative RNA binding protein YcfA, dsRBD-like fold, HicA-like mRNA interferase family [ANME-2 cluster archaeon]